MENGEKIQGRREFFKEATRKAIPIIGAVALMSNPIIAKNLNREKLSCDYDCFDGCGQDVCAGSCWNYCRLGCAVVCSDDCYQSCRGTCSNTCEGRCDGSCHGTCSGTCSNTCDGLCQQNVKWV